MGAVSIDDILRGLKNVSTDRKIRTLQELEPKLKGMKEEGVRAVCSQIVDLVRETVRVGAPSRFNPLLNQLLRTLEQLLAQPNILAFFKEENKLLEKLSLWSAEADDFPEEEIERFLLILEMLTRGVVIVFKPAFLKTLIVTCYHVILTRRHFSPIFDSALAVLVNICDANPVCILTTHDTPGFKEVWNVLYDLFKIKLESAESVRTMLLIAHLMLILDVNSNFILLTFAFGHADAISLKVLEKPDAVIKRNLLQIIIDMARLFVALTNKLESTVGPEPEHYWKSTAPQDAKLSQFVKNYVRLSKNTIARLREGYIHLQDKSLAKHILKLVAALTPTYKISNIFLEETFVSIFDIVRTIEQTRERQVPLCNVYETYSRIVTQLSTLSMFGSKSCRDLLTILLKTAKLSASNSKESLRNNIACCRIYSTAQKIQILQNTVLAKIQEESATYSELIEAYIAQPKENRCLESVTCVTEMLGLLADNSRSKPVLDLLLQGLKASGASELLALAIQSPDVHLVARALAITSTVAFSRDNLRGLSDALVKRNLGVGPLPVMSHRNTWSEAAAKGFIAVEDALEAVAVAAQRNPQDQEFAQLVDVVSMYETKANCMGSELVAVREQLHSSNKMFNDIQQLLAKQSSAIGAQVAKLELSDRNIRQLKQQVEQLNGEMGQRDIQIEKQMQCFEEQLAYSTKRETEFNKKTSQLEKCVKALEADKKDLLKKFELEKTSQRGHQKEMEDLKAVVKEKEETIKELSKRVQKGEQKLVKSAEEVKRLEHLLSKEKQTVDVIRGFLGNNSGVIP